MARPTLDRTPTNSSPKQVTFDINPLTSDDVNPTNLTTSTSITAMSPSVASSTTSTPTKPGLKRRSSLKEGLKMPQLPSKEVYQHEDPLLRRLRLRDPKGKSVDLKNEFKGITVVAFLFGARWSSGSREAYTTIDRFSQRHRDRLRVVYCSVDQDQKEAERTIEGKQWLSMEWNDGSNSEEPPSLSTTTTASTSTAPTEPFLLATDTDLESDVHLTDPTGNLYLRPYSRVHLAEKFQVLAVPTLVVYHLGKKEILSRNLRIANLKDDRGDEAWKKMDRGESLDFSLGDLMGGLKWTAAAATVAVGYLFAVRYGGAEDVVAKMSEHFVKGFLTRS